MQETFCPYCIPSFQRSFCPRAFRYLLHKDLVVLKEPSCDSARRTALDSSMSRSVRYAAETLARHLGFFLVVTSFSLPVPSEPDPLSFPPSYDDFHNPIAQALRKHPLVRVEGPSVFPAFDLPSLEQTTICTRENAARPVRNAWPSRATGDERCRTSVYAFPSHIQPGHGSATVSDLP